MWKKGLSSIITMIIGAIGGYFAGGMLNKGAVERASSELEKFKDYFLFMNQWLMLRNDGQSLKEYFEHHGYKKIAIYGFAEMGNRLYEELEDTDIEVLYAIDQNADTMYADIQVVTLEQELKKVDAVVITALRSFDAIADQIRPRLNCDLISLEEVVYELL
ncbi:MAG: hypothetical protein RR717_02185 [Lachnospiraceae bacterium]